MVSCELCGKISELYFALIEGVNLNVCSNCKSYGKIISFPKEIVKEKKVVSFNRVEVEEDIVPDFSLIIRKSREGRGLSPHDLALKLNEKESLISKIEQGSFKPNFRLARKLERFFSIKLIDKERISEAPSIIDSSILTIGDLIKKGS